MFLRNKKEKVFCIGRNKTGTTSMEALLGQMGYNVASYVEGELLLDSWIARDFDKIIQLCKKHDAFQDVPFSLNYTFMALDQAFPSAKFILTVRDNGDEWFDSLLRYHSKLFSPMNSTPTVEDLKNAGYRYKGFIWKSHLNNYINDDESLLYNREYYIQNYNEQNKNIINYFKNKKDKLLVVNVAEEDATKRIYEFLGHPYNGQVMPHLNSSK